ncbi:MAG: glycosyltransferase [Bacteroidaceae bacterium]|nr:glycosyltransferase [Bacteroidaceae bacterium]
MNILHVITSLHTGGAEKLLVDLLPRMQQAGHRVELCAFDSTPTPFAQVLQSQGIRIHSFHEGIHKVYSPCNIVRLTRLMRQGWDIVHTHNTAPQLFAAIGSLCSGALLVTTEHNTTNRRRGKAYLKPFDRWMYSHYREVVCISDQALTNFVEYFGTASRPRLSTIYNGIDFHRYAAAQPAADVRVLSPRIITNVAGFRLQKDQPTLIRAMQQLPDDFHLCLVGDGVRRAEYEALIAQLGLQSRVHLLGLRSDIPEVLAASDYVVMCSHYEGLSLSSLEGMASGRPFLADDVDGLREIVDQHGILFPHQDAEAFAREILRLEADAPLRQQVVERCQAKASQYDIARVVEQYLRLYMNLVN